MTGDYSRMENDLETQIWKSFWKPRQMETPDLDTHIDGNPRFGNRFQPQMCSIIPQMSPEKRGGVRWRWVGVVVVVVVDGGGGKSEDVKMKMMSFKKEKTKKK